MAQRAVVSANGRVAVGLRSWGGLLVEWGTDVLRRAESYYSDSY